MSARWAWLSLYVSVTYIQACMSEREEIIRMKRKKKVIVESTEH